MARIIREKASYPIPTPAANLPPERFRESEFAEALERSNAATLARKTSLKNTVAKSEELYVHRGDLVAHGKVIGYGSAMLIEGNLQVDGDVVPVSDGSRGINWLVVGGNLECRHLVVPEGVQLIVAGSLHAGGLASIATGNSMGRIGGRFTAPIALSGQSSAAFSIGGEVEVGRLFGYLADLDGHPLEIPESENASSLFESRSVDENGRLNADIVVALVACGIDPVPGAMNPSGI
jgi:hypothetical protein